MHGQVHVVADGVVGIHSVDDGADEIARVRGGVADAADAGDFGHAGQQRGEIPAGGRGIAIAVDVLPQQLDFGVALFGQAAGFGHDAFAGAAALGPAREGDDAVGAGFVAAFDDGDVGAVRIVAAGERGVEGLFGVEAQTGDAAVAGFELHQHLAEAGIAGRPGHQADVRGAFEDLLPLLLGHAAEHAENLAFAGLALEVLQAVKNFLLGLIAYAAGVIEDQVRRFRRFHLGIALLDEGADDFFGVVDIHLAAEGFEVKGFPRHCGSIVQGRERRCSPLPWASAPVPPGMCIISDAGTHGCERTS